MKSKFLFFVGAVILLLALLPLMRSRPQALPWTENANSAFNRAEKNDVAIVAYLYTDWCGYCRQMENTTFKDPDLISQLSEEFAWLRLNPETDQAGQSLQQKFMVSGFPPVLILDTRGNELDRIQGYVPPSRFIASLQLILRDSQKIAGF